MRFTTNAYPRDQRPEAWRFTLQRCLIELMASGDDVYGEVMSYQGNDGIQFLRLTGTAQSWVLDGGKSEPSFWLLLVLDGRVSAKGLHAQFEVQEGSVLFGGPARVAIEMAGDHRLLLVRVPHSLPILKGRTPLPEDIGLLPGDTATGQILGRIGGRAGRDFRTRLAICRNAPVRSRPVDSSDRGRAWHFLALFAEDV
jgi:hypothetical protein